MWLLPQKYLCQNCGYIGPIVMELEKDDTDYNCENIADKKENEERNENT
jgi:hypothetical protein